MPGLKRLLVVCTGNSCRSVIAKGLFKKRLGNREEIRVYSAGIAAMPGFRPTQETIEVMSSHGLDVSTHLTQRLTDNMIQDADLILVMEVMHKREILKRVSSAKKKVYLLREYADATSEDSNEDSKEIDVPDPIAKPIEVYESCFQMIQESVEKIVQKL